MFSNIWWGIFAVFAALQTFMIITNFSMYYLISFIINVMIVVCYVMSMIKPDEVLYRSVLSYVADCAFGFGCAGFVMYILLWVFGGAAVNSAVSDYCVEYPEYCGSTEVAKDSMFIVMLIGAVCFAAWLWLSFWAAKQIREAVFRMKWNKGESFDGVFQKP